MSDDDKPYLDDAEDNEHRSDSDARDESNDDELTPEEGGEFHEESAQDDESIEDDDDFFVHEESSEDAADEPVEDSDDFFTHEAASDDTADTISGAPATESAQKEDAGGLFEFDNEDEEDFEFDFDKELEKLLAEEEAAFAGEAGGDASEPSFRSAGEPEAELSPGEELPELPVSPEAEPEPLDIPEPGPVSPPEHEPVTTPEPVPADEPEAYVEPQSTMPVTETAQAGYEDPAAFEQPQTEFQESTQYAPEYDDDEYEFLDDLADKPTQAQGGGGGGDIYHSISKLTGASPETAKRFAVPFAVISAVIMVGIISVFLGEEPPSTFTQPTRGRTAPIRQAAPKSRPPAAPAVTAQPSAPQTPSIPGTPGAPAAAATPATPLPPPPLQVERVPPGEGTGITVPGLGDSPVGGGFTSDFAQQGMSEVSKRVDNVAKQAAEMDDKLDKVGQAVVMNAMAVNRLSKHVGGLDKKLTTLSENVEHLAKVQSKRPWYTQSSTPLPPPPGAAMRHSTRDGLPTHAAVAGRAMPSKRAHRKRHFETHRYNIDAMVPGRAWLKDENGSTLTVTIGDRVRGYGVVSAIDPEQGIVMTSSGLAIRFESG